MLKLNELKEGDLVMVEYDGQWTEGEITNVNHLDKQVCISNIQDQEFWYEVQHVKPIVLDEAYIFKLGFQKQPNDDGSVKYTKGAFRVLTHQPGVFSNFEMWYREDRRHIDREIYVHEFQNNFLAMTKVPLTQGE